MLWLPGWEGGEAARPRPRGVRGGKLGSDGGAWAPPPAPCQPSLVFHVRVACYQQSCLVQVRRARLGGMLCFDKVDRSEKASRRGHWSWNLTSGVGQGDLGTVFSKRWCQGPGGAWLGGLK